MEGANNEINAHFRFRKVVLGLSLALWLASLALPALISDTPHHTVWGMNILLVGWLGIVGVLAVGEDVGWLGVLAWWANPIYLLVLGKTLRRKRPPAVSPYATGFDLAFVSYVALALASLTVLLSRYPVNAAGGFAPIVGYGPGALLWYLAILSIVYVVSRDAGNPTAPKLLVGAVGIVCVAYTAQLAWRAVGSNQSEREQLPVYSAKRGLICSARATPLPILEPQPAIRLEAKSKVWLESLRNWRVSAVQIGSLEYTRAPAGSDESRKAPFMVAEPIASPARYTLRVQGGHPYVNDAHESGDHVRLSLWDSHANKEIGQLVHHREANRLLGFCPSLTYFPYSPNEEAIRWLAPFIRPS
jgi:hypothetical protein